MRFPFLPILPALLAATPLAAGQVQLLQPADPEADHTLAVGRAGDWMVVGARLHDDPFDESGAAWVYQKQGTTWVEQARLPLNPPTQAWFGSAVAIDADGDRVVVGSHRRKNSGKNFAGRAHVFERNGTSWSQATSISGPSAFDFAGWAVAIDDAGTTAMVGAPGEDVGGNGAGAVYVLSDGGSGWLLESTIVPPDAGGLFGSAIAFDQSGDRAVIGAPADGEIASAAGAAHVYARAGTTWLPAAKLLPPIGTEPSSGFGGEIALSDDGLTVAVAGPGRSYVPIGDSPNSVHGSVAIYRDQGTTWALETLIDEDYWTLDEAGLSLALDPAGSSLCVSGLHGTFPDYEAMAYLWSRQGSTWVQTEALACPTFPLGGPSSGTAPAGLPYLHDVALPSATERIVAFRGTTDGVAVSAAPPPALTVPGQYGTIQAAIAAASDCDTIRVDPGTYVENIDFLGRSVRIESTGGPAVTTIQGVGGSVVTLTSGETSYASLAGFTITGGDAQVGGGMRIANGASPIVRDCVFVGNVSATRGGGVDVRNDSNPWFGSCTFVQNSAALGGGISVGSGSQIRLMACRLLANDAALEGGGLYATGQVTDVELASSLVADNTADTGGAATTDAGANLVWRYCTVVDNVAINRPGGIYGFNGDAFVRDSIVWNNSHAGGTTVGSQAFETGVSSIQFGWTTVMHGWFGNGNMTADPLFVDAPHGDYRIGFASPAIDQAFHLQPPGPTDIRQDIDGFRRFESFYFIDHADRGAFEFQPPCGPTGEPFVYCTAKANSLGCVPSIGSTGQPSATSGQPFVIDATDVLNARNGLFFYGTVGRASLPFFGGTLCVQPPLRRTGVQSSGGTPPPTSDCSGVYSFDFNALARSGLDPALVPGVIVTGQYWSRDPNDPSGVGLTNAIEFELCD